MLDTHQIFHLEVGGMTSLSDSHPAVLRALCDTIVPRIERDPDPDGFWARTASDVGADAGVAELIAEMPEEQRDGLKVLLDVLASQGFLLAPSQLSREQLLTNLMLGFPQAAEGVAALSGLVLFLSYGAPDLQTGQNPSWRTFGYPGPGSPPPEVPKPIQPIVPERDELTLEADVCVVGSGSGGATIAGVLAPRGLEVVALEAAGYRNESDFTQLELKAYQEMYWRGGPQPTADGNVSLLAGTTLGGGTVVNWTNCLRMKPGVREQWAREFGLEGLDGRDFERHQDAVLERIGATDELSDLNEPHKRMKQGCERLGWSFRTVVRNADPGSYRPESAGYMGFGDQTGSKRSADKTWLVDAVEAGADVLVDCRAQRVLTENGRAAGVEALYADPRSGRTARVTVRAPHVVVACGSLESPALLLRSGIGGPAVGDHLRVHPTSAVLGVYAEDQKAWWGAPQAGLCDEFADTGDGYGFLIEGAQYTTGIAASAFPWTSGRRHKEVMADYGYVATFIAVTRDRGHGRVELDRDGEAVAWYPVSDEVDLRNLRHGVEVETRLHEAAGAQRIHPLAFGLPTWRRGDDLEAFIATAQGVSMRAGGYRLFSAHQMGSCRMGTDPKTSVANPRGELHEVPGVWIGDGSAFPTSSGTNPMVAIMALARRTADAIAEAASARGGGEAVAAEAAP